MKLVDKDGESENVCDNLENSCQTFMAYIRGLTKLLAATKVWKRCGNRKLNIYLETCLFITLFLVF